MLQMSIPIHERNPPTRTVSEVFNHPSLLVFFASFIKPNIYLEYGVAKGNVIIQVAQFAKQVIGVDIEDHVENKPENMTLHVMHTTEFKSILLSQNMVVDMAFIDASHKSSDAFNDFKDIYPHVIDNGFIFLHDTYPTQLYLTEDGACSDSWRVPAMIKQNYPDCEILTIPICPGLSIIRKNTIRLPWMT